MERLEVSEGTSMDADIALPKERPNGAGILVFPKAFGVNSYIRNVVVYQFLTERLEVAGFRRYRLV
jgi:dienelactone hydrolase